MGVCWILCPKTHSLLTKTYSIFNKVIIVVYSVKIFIGWLAIGLLVNSASVLAPTPVLASIHPLVVDSRVFSSMESIVGFYVLKLIVCKQRYILFSIKLLLMFIQ